MADKDNVAENATGLFGVVIESTGIFESPPKRARRAANRWNMRGAPFAKPARLVPPIRRVERQSSWSIPAGHPIDTPPLATRCCAPPVLTCGALRVLG